MCRYPYFGNIGEKSHGQLCKRIIGKYEEIKTDYKSELNTKEHAEYLIKNYRKKKRRYR